MIPSDFKLSVIMPVYNEKDTVLRVLDRVLAVPIDKQVVVIDNCSTDGTREILRGIHAGDSVDQDVHVTSHRTGDRQDAGLDDRIARIGAIPSQG